jgi:hypothetical protein
MLAASPLSIVVKVNRRERSRISLEKEVSQVYERRNNGGGTGSPLIFSKIVYIEKNMFK